MSAGLEWSIIGPAFLAGLVVLATHVPLGREVLARGIVFIDLAIAQIAALGVIAAYGLGLEDSPWAIQAAAAGAALLGALLMTWTERRWPQLQEALIGTAFVLAASGGLLLLAGSPHGGEHLKDLLAGQILWVSYAEVGAVALVSALLLAARAYLARRASRAGFYLIFAVAVTASVQLVGVYLVFASLIVPALACRGLDTARALPLGFALGALGYGLGLLVSAWRDLPSGPVIVWTLAALALPCGLALRRRPLSPRRARPQGVDARGP